MSKEYIKPLFLLQSLESDLSLAAEDVSGDHTDPGYEDDKDQGFGPWIPLFYS